MGSQAPHTAGQRFADSFPPPRLCTKTNPSPKLLYGAVPVPVPGPARRPEPAQRTEHPASRPPLLLEQEGRIIKNPLVSNKSNAEPFPWRAGRGAELRGLSPQRDRAGDRRGGLVPSRQRTPEPAGTSLEAGGSKAPLSRGPAQGDGSPPRRDGTHRLRGPRLSQPRAERARAEGEQVAGAAPRAPPCCRPELMRTAPAATHGGRIKRPGCGSARPGSASAGRDRCLCPGARGRALGRVCALPKAAALL